MSTITNLKIQEIISNISKDKNISKLKAKKILIESLQVYKTKLNLINLRYTEVKRV